MAGARWSYYVAQGNVLSGRCADACCACPPCRTQPGKLVQDSDAKREVLQQLESSCREGLMAVGSKQAVTGSKAAKGSSRTPPPASPAATATVAAAGLR
jgi:hypothetical protein